MGFCARRKEGRDSRRGPIREFQVDGFDACHCERRGQVLRRP